MKTPRWTPRSSAWWPLTLVVATSMCQRPTARSRPMGLDTTNVDTASVATVARYGASLDYDTVLGVADAQPLFAKGNVRYGFAKIEPVKLASAFEVSDLARGQIVARISSESAYAGLGVGPGMNWWWVDHRHGQWRSIIYSEARNSTSRNVLDSLPSHPAYPWRQSIARFVILDTIVAAWQWIDGHCVRAFNFPLWYSRLEGAAPWRTPRK